MIFSTGMHTGDLYCCLLVDLSKVIHLPVHCIILFECVQDRRAAVPVLFVKTVTSIQVAQVYPDVHKAKTVC